MLSKLKKTIGSNHKDLLHFRYRSHREEHSLEAVEAEAEILQKEGGTFYSVITYFDMGVSEEVLNNPNFFSVRRTKSLSRLKAEVNKEIWDNQNQYRQQVKEDLEKKGITEQRADWGKHLDRAYARIARSLEEEILERLLREDTYYTLLDENVITEETNDDDIEAAITRRLRGRYLKNLKESMIAPVYENEHTPRFGKVFGSKLSYLFNDRFFPGQCFLHKNKQGQISYIHTSSRGSGTRENKGFYSHVYAALQKKGVKIETFVLYLNRDFELSVASFEELVLDGRDLTGNFHLDRRASEAFLHNIKKIYSKEDIEEWS